MANVNVLGDIVRIKTDITDKQYQRVKNFCPNALKLIDIDGNEHFGISAGDAHVSKYGISFSSVDFDGKMFMSTNNPVLDHTDAETEKAEVTRTFAPIISNLIQVEKQVEAVEADMDAMETEVSESITFA